MFTSKAVLTERLDNAIREKEFWQNRALDLERKLEAEQDRNRKREEYLFDLAVVKVLHASPVQESQPEQSKPQPEPPILTDFYNEHFREWAREAGVTDYDAKKYWEINKDQYASVLASE